MYHHHASHRSSRREPARLAAVLGRRGLAGVLALAGILGAAGTAGAQTHQFFELTVRDAATQAPLACVDLRTTSNDHFVSDNNGKIAFYEPGLMGESVWFDPGPYAGYCFPRIEYLGLCSEGKAFTPVEGGSAVFDVTPVGPDGICATSCCDCCRPGYETLPKCCDPVTNPGCTVSPPVCPAICTPGAPIACDGGDDGTQLLAGPVPSPAQRLRIEVRDEATGRGVPLVEVRSPKGSRWTDNAGLVAFHDPDLMNQSVFFEVESHGYDLVDPMGLGGVTLATTPGATAEITVRRKPVQIAERLYRITGASNYAETSLLGGDGPLVFDNLNAKVTGQDSTLSTLYQGKPFFVWGDTNRISAALGSFKAPGATALLPSAGGLDPEVGVDLNYFVDGTGFAKGLCPITTPAGPCWLGGLTTLKDAGGVERLYAGFGIFPALAAPVRSGLLRFDDNAQSFVWLRDLTLEEAGKLGGHPLRWTHGAVEYAYYPETSRILATEAAILDPAGYQVYTGLVAGTTNQIERDAQGTIVYGWKTGTPAIGQALVDQGLLTPSEALFGHIVEPDTNREPLLSSRSVTWNDHRRRFVRVQGEVFGATSLLGEIWYLEGDTPMGPWVYARQIITHDDYSLYNVRHHAFYDKEGGRKILFEGTYTASFSNGTPTPRYNYNQVMYKLDLDRDELVLPVPVYDLGAGGTPGAFVTKNGLRSGMASPPAPFMAWDRAAPGSVPVTWSGAACAERALVAGASPAHDPVFWALPANTQSPPAETTPLYEYANASTGARAYSIDPGLSLPGFSLVGPLVLVWRNPLAVTLPTTEYLAPLVADAGPDQCVTETFEGTGAAVALDGTASSHAGGTIASWQWTQLNGALTASGATAQMTLPAGTHWIRLTTTDTQGKTSTDVVTIHVAVGPPCNAFASTAAPATARWALAALPLLVFALVAAGARMRRA